MATVEDPHKFLEDVLGEEPMAWVKERNAACIAALGDPTETERYRRILAILDSKDKIPGINQIGDESTNVGSDGRKQRRPGTSHSIPLQP